MALDASSALLAAGNGAIHTVADTGLGTKATKEERARAQARDFEQVYLSTMFNQMFAGLDTNGPYHGGFAEETWRGMLVDKFAGEVARSGGVGIADAVYRELIHVQEGAAK